MLRSVLIETIIGCASVANAGHATATATATTVAPMETVIVSPAHVAQVQYVTRCSSGRCYRVPQRSVAVSRVRTGRVFVFRPWLRGSRSRAVARTRN